MKKIIDSIGNVSEKIGDAFDKNFSSKEEILALLKDVQGELLAIKRDILITEMQGNKLQRNWRPILMLTFGFIITYSILIAPLLFHFWNIPQPVLHSQLWDVIQLAIGGYVMGRSAEKIMPGAVRGMRNLRNRKSK